MQFKDTVLVLAPSFTMKSNLKSCVILKPDAEPIKLEKGKPIPIIRNAVYLYDGIPDVLDDEMVKTVIFAAPDHECIKEQAKNPTMRTFVCLFIEFALTDIMLRQTLGYPATRRSRDYCSSSEYVLLS
jgi:hypothetical protein